LLIRDLEERDWPAVKAIFEEGIAAGLATFETEAPSWEDWDGAHLPLRLVAEEDGAVVGWAALTPYSDRECYRGVAESSVYVAERARGRGVGFALMERLAAARGGGGRGRGRVGGADAVLRPQLLPGRRGVERLRGRARPRPGCRASADGTPRA